MNNYFFKVADRVTYIILHIQKGPSMFFYQRCKFLQRLRK